MSGAHCPFVVAVVAALMVAGCAIDTPAQRALAKIQNDPDADNLPMDDASVRKRRMAIATLLERNGAFGLPGETPKLYDAKLAGPMQATGNLFGKPEIVYCASALYPIPFSFFPMGAYAVIRIKKTETGAELMRASAGRKSQWECFQPKYEPFPELELARARHRQALGKTDS